MILVRANLREPRASATNFARGQLGRLGEALFYNGHVNQVGTRADRQGAGELAV
jgi:hypothetical protein